MVRSATGGQNPGMRARVLSRRYPAFATPGVAKPLSQIGWDRVVNPSFEPDDVPDDDLETMLALALQAPSGHNLQPWRFVVVRGQEQRDLLCAAAYNHAAVAEAPVVVAAYGRRRAWSEHAEEILGPASDREDCGAGDAARKQDAAFAFVRAQDIAVWLTRHVMVAFTYLLIAAESMGWDALPLEDFDAARASVALGLPADAELVALLAIGRLRERDRVAPHRLPLERLVSVGYHGVAWPDPVEHRWRRSRPVTPASP